MLEIGNGRTVRDTFDPRFEDQIEAVLDARPPVLSFVFGIPSRDILRALHQRAIKTIGAATTVDEACALEEAGVHLIVASGSDAGGHRPSFLKSSEASLTGTLALIPQVVDAVDTPIVAAGGIGDGRGIVAALVLGAEGAQLGTVFAPVPDSKLVHATYPRRGGSGRTRRICGPVGRSTRGAWSPAACGHDLCGPR